MCINVLPACKCSTVCLVPKKKKARQGADHLELEFWMVMSYHVGAGDETGVCKYS